MPKPLLKTPQNLKQQNISINITYNQSQQQLSQNEKMKLDRIFRQPRSKEYMNAVKQLDAGGHVHNKKKVDAIIQAIRDEFPEVELAGVLLGYVDKCYLGSPYEVHTLDLAGEIIDHYKIGETLPNGMEKARSIAMRGGYEFIEVYADCCRAISSNGSVSVIPG